MLDILHGAGVDANRLLAYEPMSAILVEVHAASRHQLTSLYLQSLQLQFVAVK